MQIDEKALKQVAIDEIRDKKYERIQYLLNALRLIGSFVMVVDIVLKIQYYNAVRFVERPLR